MSKLVPIQRGIEPDSGMVIWEYVEMEGETMSETKHTPGPWSLEHWDYGEGRPDETMPTICTDDTAVAQVLAIFRPDDADHGESERDANARLIAAAPDLLAACEAAFNYVNVPNAESLYWQARSGKMGWEEAQGFPQLRRRLANMFRAAIAKARGEA